MSGETQTDVTHLSDVMTMDQGDMTGTTGEDGVTSSSSRGVDFYFGCFVVVIGVIGIAANGVVLYALVASKQHTKNELIVNQNALDLYNCLFLVITYGLKLCDIHLSGSLGYWLCMLLYSEGLLFIGVTASWVNLMIIAVERYLKIVHHAWSKKRLRKWMIYAAMAGAWFSGLIHEIAMMVGTSSVTLVDGACHGDVTVNLETMTAIAIYYLLFTYVAVLVVFIFCYGKILMVIRRQARVMAGHNLGGTVNWQATLHVDRPATIPVDRTPLRPISQTTFSPT